MEQNILAQDMYHFRTTIQCLFQIQYSMQLSIQRHKPLGSIGFRRCSVQSLVGTYVRQLLYHNPNNIENRYVVQVNQLSIANLRHRRNWSLEVVFECWYSFRYSLETRSFHRTNAPRIREVNHTASMQKSGLSINRGTCTLVAFGYVNKCNIVWCELFLRFYIYLPRLFTECGGALKTLIYKQTKSIFWEAMFDFPAGPSK